MVLTPVVVGGWELEVGFVGGIGVGIEACGGYEQKMTKGTTTKMSYTGQILQNQ